MNITDLIKELKQNEIEISFFAGKLKYSGPEKHITPELIDKLKKHKSKLIKYLWPKELTNLMPINPEGNNIPIFLVHGDNGNYIIRDHFGIDQPVYGFFHHGSEGEIIRFKTVKEMAKSYLDMVLTIAPIGPFNLIGFSFGGVLAFEMAVQLQKAGYEVPCLILIDSFSPKAIEPKSTFQGNFFSLIRINLLRPIRIKLDRDVKILVCKSHALLNKPIPLRRRKFYMWDKYKRLTKKYRPEKYKGDILLFKTNDNKSSMKYLGWEGHANSVKMITLHASHLKIFENKNSVAILQTEIEKQINLVNNS